MRFLSIFDKLGRRLRSKRESGQVLVATAAGMVTFTLLVALVADVGLMYLRRVQISNAADAAVLAGVQALPGDPPQALALATEYANVNGVKGQVVTPTLSTDKKEIDVTINLDQPLFFTRLSGVGPAKMHARARALVTPVYKLKGARPFGVVEQQFVFGQSYKLKFGAGSGSDPTGYFKSGNFAALALGSSGASTYEENIRFGYQGGLQVGQTIPTETGNMTGPTRKGMADLVHSCPHTPACTFASRHEDCPRNILVPVINPDADLAGRSPVRILGFAYFFVEDAVGNGNDAYVVGRFIKRSIDFPGDPIARDYGLYSYALIK